MISPQELSMSILSDNPLKFYVLGGTEHGIKDKYIEKLEKLYGSKLEYPDVESVLSMVTKKHLVPLPPSVYIVRYDATFASSLNMDTANKIKRAKINGTVVCIYSDDKQLTKIDKFLPDYTAIVPMVDTKFIIKYLHDDFPRLDDRSIAVAAKYSADYSQARSICKSMCYASPEELNRMSETELASLFGCTVSATEKELKNAIASRNFAKLVKLAPLYEGSTDTILYTILQTMIELEKILTSKYSNSDLASYRKLWKVEDVFFMFMHTYQELEKLRSNTSSSAENSLVYLAGLMTFKDIPPMEALNGN